MSEFPEKLEFYVEWHGQKRVPHIAIEGNGELFDIDLSFYPEESQKVLENLIEELVRRWNGFEDLPRHLAKYLAEGIDKLHKEGLPMDFTREGLEPILEQGIAALAKAKE